MVEILRRSPGDRAGIVRPAGPKPQPTNTKKMPGKIKRNELKNVTLPYGGRAVFKLRRDLDLRKKSDLGGIQEFAQNVRLY